jgi:hypothetical protein
MGQHLATIQADPVEGRVGEVVAAGREKSLVCSGGKRPEKEPTHMLFQDNFCVKKLSHPDNLAI